MNTALIGYARCSTDNQDLTAQVQALEHLDVTPDRILGEFDFSDEKLQDTTGVLPPKKQAKIIPENWKPPNRRKKPRFNKISKVLLPIRYLYAVIPHNAWQKGWTKACRHPQKAGAGQCPYQRWIDCTRRSAPQSWQNQPLQSSQRPETQLKLRMFSNCSREPDNNVTYEITPTAYKAIRNAIQ